MIMFNIAYSLIMASLICLLLYAAYEFISIILDENDDK